MKKLLYISLKNKTMKKILFFLLIVIGFSANSQSITSILPSGGQLITMWDKSDIRIPVSATVDIPNAYAVVFSIDPIGKTKVLQGKNNNAGAAVTFPSSRGDYKLFEIVIIANKVLDPTIPHRLRVDVYGTSFRDLVDSQETTFTIKYINP